MKTKKIEKLLDKQRRQIIRNLDDAIKVSSDNTRKILRNLRRNATSQNSKTTTATSISFRDKKNRTIARMIQELYFMSGTSSGSEEYRHMVGEDAIILRSIKNDLTNNIPISIEKISKLYNIYSKIYPDSTEQIKKDLGLK